MDARKWWDYWCVGGGCGGLSVATVRRFILLNIDTLRSTASSARSDVMAKEGHVNYDISNAPVEACAAPTTGRGWYGWVLAGADVSSNYSFCCCVCAL